MKKLSIVSMGISLFLMTSISAFAGACSGHDGVDCSAGQSSWGNVVCNDGWTGSSVSYVAGCYGSPSYVPYSAEEVKEEVVEDVLEDEIVLKGDKIKTEGLEDIEKNLLDAQLIFETNKDDACYQLDIITTYFIKSAELATVSSIEFQTFAIEEPSTAKNAMYLFDTMIEIGNAYADAATVVLNDYTAPLCSKEEDVLDNSVFSDLTESHKNYSAIMFLKENGIVNGYDNGDFKPSSEINRAELLKILIEGVGITPTVEEYNNCFTDVTTEWYAPYACYAKSEKWIKGYDDGTFKPSQSVIKAEAIKMVINTQGIDVLETVTEEPFSDVESVQWFAPFVLKAKELKLLEEVGDKYLPASNITRGGVSENIYRAIQYNNSKKTVEEDVVMDDVESIENIKESDVVEEEKIDNEIAIIELSGKGSKATEQFELEEGLYIFTFNHKGDSNFITTLLDEEGNRKGGISNEIGNAEGRSVLNVDKGSYLLNVKADGDWDLEISQPRNIEPIEGLNSFSGENDEITDSFKLEEGLSIFTYAYEGDSNFITTLLDEEGNREGSISNKIGDTEGQTVLNVGEGVYFLNIVSSGDWDISFEEPRNPEGKEIVSNLSGTGDRISDFYTLKKGLMTFEFDHKGDSNFIVRILNEDGKYVGNIVNEIGDAEGSKALGIKEDGVYIFDIVADGEWSIDIN